MSKMHQCQDQPLHGPPHRASQDRPRRPASTGPALKRAPGMWGLRWLGSSQRLVMLLSGLSLVTCLAIGHPWGAIAQALSPNNLFPNRLPPSPVTPALSPISAPISAPVSAPVLPPTSAPISAPISASVPTSAPLSTPIPAPTQPIGPSPIAAPVLTRPAIAAQRLAPEEPVTTAQPRPATREVTLQVEGEAMAVALELYQHPAGQFSTYVLRDDFAIEVLPEDATDDPVAVRFVAAAGGMRQPQAYVQISPGRVDQSLAEAEQAAIAAIETRGYRLIRDAITEQGMEERYPWATMTRLFEGSLPDIGPVVGMVAVGQVGNRPVTAIAHLPAEYAEGYGPRIDWILRYLDQ